MKLLIPTDFSDFSDYAIQMGIKIAKITLAEIHLVHCIDSTSIFDNAKLEKISTDDIEFFIRKYAQEKLELFQRDVNNHGIPCCVFLMSGRLIENLKTLNDEEFYDAIIMGSHGASGMEEWFVGSNTTKAIRKLHHNVLVVKKPVDRLDFEEVLFVTGLNEKEKESFRKFLDFIKPFKVKEIHIMAVDTNNYFSQPSHIMQEALNDFKKIASEVDIESHFYKDYSIQAGIRHFSDEYNIDLVGISNYVRHPLKRMISGSNVEMLINRSDIPVLSIDYK